MVTGTFAISPLSPGLAIRVFVDTCGGSFWKKYKTIENVFSGVDFNKKENNEKFIHFHKKTHIILNISFYVRRTVKTPDDVLRASLS